MCSVGVLLEGGLKGVVGLLWLDTKSNLLLWPDRFIGLPI